MERSGAHSPSGLIGRGEITCVDGRLIRASPFVLLIMSVAYSHFGSAEAALAGAGSQSPAATMARSGRNWLKDAE
jgi:hypothetical protein